MRILLPIKRVIDPYAKVKPLGDGSGIDTGNVKFDVNPFDEIAVEEAVRMKEKDPSIETIAISIGGAECEDQLRKCLAMGADKAILVESTREHDPSTIAHELKAWVEELKPDLILMGKQSTDGESNQVGQMLAALLGWPQATYASKITIEGGNIEVVRETDSGEETLTLPLPAVVTTDLRLNEPRYIALPGIIRARNKPLEKATEKSNKEPNIRYTKFQSPPARPAGRKVANVTELLAALSERGVSL
ncbi:MAG: electron transfer flavoprotein subunit beta/FixA family protein [Armatimonadetes bacterium]|nr:electron transfer flavoprotein subunit beta/FixA family protein [Armatimonadota bacterium]